MLPDIYSAAGRGCHGYHQDQHKAGDYQGVVWLLHEGMGGDRPEGLPSSRCYHWACC